MSTVRPASVNCRVTCISAWLGEGSPLGWLWVQTTAVAPSRIAARKTSIDLSNGYGDDDVARPKVGRTEKAAMSRGLLLIDDDDTMREALRAMLELLGYDVCEARNGGEA